MIRAEGQANFMILELAEKTNVSAMQQAMFFIYRISYPRARIVLKKNKCKKVKMRPLDEILQKCLSCFISCPSGI